MTPEDIEYIVVHCSATRPSMDIGAAEIRRWHTSPDPNDPSKPWRDIGYHYVIRRDGTIEPGRTLTQAGAHAAGVNYQSWGVCLVGGVREDNRFVAEDNFTAAQMNALEEVLFLLTEKAPGAQVLGHRDLPGVAKACPSFDARAWWARELEPPPPVVTPPEPSPEPKPSARVNLFTRLFSGLRRLLGL